MTGQSSVLHYAARMRGDLVEKTAADVCRGLAASEASGVLAIEGPDGPARVVFVAGRIIAAVSPAPRARLGDRLVGAGELDPDDLARALRSQDESGQNPRLGAILVEQGMVRPDAVRVFVQEQVLDALFEIIRWRYGAFMFTADDGSGATGIPLSLTVDDALVEVARRQQEWQQLSRVIPDLGAIPSFRQGAASASASLEPDEFAVLASVDGERSIRSLASDLGYGEFEAARIVYGLSLLGVVDVRLPQDAIGAALEDALAFGPTDREEAPDDHSADIAVAPGQGDDEGPSAKVYDIGASDEPNVWVSRPDDDPTPDAGPAAPPPPPAASMDMPDFFVTPPAGRRGTDEAPRDNADTDAPDDHGTTLDITFDVPETSPDAPRHGSEPPDVSAADAFNQLYADDDRDGGGPRGSTEGPVDTPAGQGGTGTPDDASTGEEPGPEGAPPAPAPQRGDDKDVSEFMRELSRLYLDQPGKDSPNRPKPPKADPPAPPPTKDSDAGKKKRRGFFGRG